MYIRQLEVGLQSHFKNPQAMEGSNRPRCNDELFHAPLAEADVGLSEARLSYGLMRDCCLHFTISKLVHRLLSDLLPATGCPWSSILQKDHIILL